jgi:hypothetical protein
MLSSMRVSVAVSDFRAKWNLRHWRNKILNLTKLKLMYPSVTRDHDSADNFWKEFRKVNNIYPHFATRGLMSLWHYDAIGAR